MRKFITESGVHQKDNNTTDKIMRSVLFALIPIVLFSFFKNGIYPFYKGEANLIELFYPLLIIISGAITSIGIEALYLKFIKNELDLKAAIKKSYALFPGLFLGLVLPIGTPLHLVILGTAVGVIIGKLIFGGFGKNILNPALVGYLFLFLVFPLNFTSANYMNPYEAEVISSATPLSNIASLEYSGTIDSFIAPYGEIRDYLLGLRPGSPAEVSIILLLIAFIYLVYVKAIKVRIPIYYVGTVLIMNLILVLITGLDMPLVLMSIISGGLLFGAIFMATDPVTSPVTKIGQIVYGLMLGVLTFGFRYLGDYAEGVMFSILIMNLLSRLLDRVCFSYNFNKKKGLALIIVTLAIMGFSVYYVSKNITIANNENEKPVGFEIINIEQNNSLIYYTVTQKCFKTVKAKVTLNIEGEVKEVLILENSETFYDQIVEENYIEKIIENQDDLDSLDTISGATRTSGGLKKLVENVLMDFNN